MLPAYLFTKRGVKRGVRRVETVKKPVDPAHQLNISNRNLIAMEGVINMDSYDQEKVILTTSLGALEIRGNNLHVQQLNLEQGKVTLDGEVVSLNYSDENAMKKGKGFLGRLIK
jgi:sporulation protein YabP